MPKSSSLSLSPAPPTSLLKSLDAMCGKASAEVIILAWRTYAWRKARNPGKRSKLRPKHRWQAQTFRVSQELLHS